MIWAARGRGVININLLRKRNGNSDLDVNWSLFFIELIGLSAQSGRDGEAESVQSSFYQTFGMKN